MSSPLGVPGAKATLALATIMTGLGFIGLVSSFSGLTMSPGAAAESPAVTPELAELAILFVTDPLGKALRVANLLVSAMLVIASFSITGRTRSALWWASQALWANAGYSLAVGGINAYLILTHEDVIARTFHALQTTESVPPNGERAFALTLVAGSLMIGAALATLYVVLYRVAKRETVQKFIRREA